MATERLPVAPSLEPVLVAARVPNRTVLVDRRVLLVSGLAIGVAFAAAVVAQGLVALIGLVTTLAFYGRVSTAFASPAGNHLGPLVILVPAAGGLVVGLMARFGSQAIRGHGIPEAMARRPSSPSGSCRSSVGAPPPTSSRRSACGTRS